ncbi:hypothetical protein R1C46_26550 [Bacillus tropicus]
MARQYGYFYDDKGRFTEMLPLEERNIFEKQISYREEIKSVVTEEKLCELHQSIENGTYKYDLDKPQPISKYECPDCTMFDIRTETIKVPYEEEVWIGSEPDVPDNCTLEPCLYADATWDGTKWIYDRDINPPEKPTEPENPQTPEEVIRDILLDRIIKLEARTLALEKRYSELESDIKSSIGSGGDTAEKEPMNPEDLPNYTPSDETPEPKQDLLALYLNPSVGKE